MKAMAWSPQFPSTSAKWGTVYFAIGTRAGHLYVFALKNGKPVLVKHIELSGHIITRLEWSSSIETSSGECE